MQLVINVAKDFSPIPGARYPKEGDFSGQEFRTKLLSPKLKEAIEKKTILLVDLDGTLGYGTSFLEEAFGGLIRSDKFNLGDIKKHLQFSCKDDPTYIEEINSYIEDAYEREHK